MLQKILTPNEESEVIAQIIHFETSRFHSEWPEQGILSAMAFHEKAGRSQVGSFVFLLDKVFSSAKSPLTPSFHPHSQ